MTEFFWWCAYSIVGAAVAEIAEQINADGPKPIPQRRRFAVWVVISTFWPAYLLIATVMALRTRA